MKRLQIAASALVFFALTTVVLADGTSTVVPLTNTDFSSPAVVAPAKWINGAKAPGWTYDGNNLAGVGVAVAFWNPKRPSSFFWNSPDGSITQIVDVSKYAIKHAGDVFVLSANLGGQGKGTIHETSEILVDGKSATAVKTDIVDPKGLGTAATVVYVAKAQDVGKSVGVRFSWTKPDTAMQAGLSDVSLTVTPKQ